MATIVLLHGAWQGAWCWERVAPTLAAAGHQIVTPDLTGCGARAAEMSSSVTLDTHVSDVLATLSPLDGDDIVLVGHSYSGMVITAVADQVDLSALVFVDAFYPADGESALDQMPPPFQDRFRAQAEAEGDGWKLRANPGLLDVWGLHDEDDRAWVLSRLSDWSLNCFASPLRAPQLRRTTVPRTYVSATAEGYPARAAFSVLAQRAADDGARVVTVDTGHDVMIEAPDRLAEIILEAAAQNAS